MTEAVIRIPEKLIPVFQGRADVRWSCGGRGSAKTRSFAKMAAFCGMRFGQSGVTGQILCARQFMNSLDESSLEEVKRAIEDEPLLQAYYEVGERYIRSHDGRISFAFAGLDKSINSVKSKGRILICWVDEAEPVTDQAWIVLIPTLREESDGWNAELWLTWNPARKTAPVERRFRNSDDPLIKGAVMNWRDNNKFPEKLERDRQRDMADRPEQYDHIWEGGFATIVEGAYYAKHLAKAKEEGRISVVGPDPLIQKRVYIDIGGTSMRADAFAMWVVQFVGMQIRVLAYYEAVGQEMAEHVQWLRDNGHDKAMICLPHDGETHDKVFRVTPAGEFRSAGFSVVTAKNLGAGAKSLRIAAVKRVFPQIWFNETKTEGGREALGWYHEKRDDKRDIGLGPAHDWASHAADAFGEMAVDYEQNKPMPSERIVYPNMALA